MSKTDRNNDELSDYDKQVIKDAKKIQKKFARKKEKYKDYLGKRYQLIIKITKVDCYSGEFDFESKRGQGRISKDGLDLYDLIVDKDLKIVETDEKGEPVELNITYDDWVEILLALRQRIIFCIHPQLDFKLEELELIHKKIEALALGHEYDSEKIVLGVVSRETDFKKAIALLPKEIKQEIDTELNLILMQNQKLAKQVKELTAELDGLLTIPGAEETRYTIIKVAKIGTPQIIKISDQSCPDCHSNLSLLEKETPDVEGNLINVFNCSTCDKLWAQPYDEEKSDAKEKSP